MSPLNQVTTCNTEFIAPQIILPKVINVFVRFCRLRVPKCVVLCKKRISFLILYCLCTQLPKSNKSNHKETV